MHRFAYLLVVTCLLLSRSPYLMGQAPPVEAAAEKKAESVEQVRLEFRDQMWLPALEWLAGKLHLNLDWRSLPEGTLNLHSEKTYSLAEAEDLINMQLLARGFTLLKRGEVMRVEPLKEIDITLVPRVEPESLSEMPKHSVVRVSFSLSSMLAADAATDLKPLLSPYGNMHPLISANRLEVMDAVVNLREVHRLLTTTDSGQGKRQRIVEIKLKNRKASEIAPMVRQLLGMPPDGLPNASTQAQLDIEQTRLRAEAVKQLGGNAKEMLTDRKPEVFLVVNEKENSILVHAPPEKMDVARQAIESLDKMLPPTESAWEAMNKVKVYSVSGYDPAAITGLLKSLQDIGNLAKETRIQHDAVNQRIITVAEADDQLTISRLVEQFRGERRSAHVLPLSDVEPDYAVNAVKLVLKPAERSVAGADGKFEVEADTTHQRLLLWATGKEVEEVRQFLGQLGGNVDVAEAEKSRFQVVQLGGASFESVAERFRQVWEDMAEAPLVIETQLMPADLKSQQPPAKPPGSEEKGASETDSMEAKPVFTSTAAPMATSPQQSQNQAAAPAGVRLMEGKNGDIVIVSRDPKLAASAKRLLEQLTPSREDVRVVSLQHAQASSVKTHLEDVLPKVRLASTSRLDPVRPATSIQVDARLNRLLVQHCTNEQWEAINQIVAVLDVAAEDDELERKQVVHRLRYRRATEVAKALKDVYKDLMEDRTKITSAATTTQRASGFSRGLAASSRNPEYQGLLSIGVDEEANLLIISAPSYMIDEVIKVVDSMDTRKDGTSIAVVPLNHRSIEFKANHLNKTLEVIKKARSGK